MQRLHSHLWYLGMWGWGVANLLGVLGVGVVAALTLPEEVFYQNIGLLSAACGGGSGGLALALAQHRNERRRTVSQAKADDP
jgi:hypothetical protein